VIIIPAGVAHKNLGSSAYFRCVGGYPPGQSWDMNFERQVNDQKLIKTSRMLLYLTVILFLGRMVLDAIMEKLLD